MRLALLLALIGFGTSAAHGQTAVYTPYRQYTPPIAQWQTTLRNATNGPGTGTRPVLPGLRSADTELLTDALLRKQPKALQGNPELARAKIRRIALDSLKPGNKAIYRLYGDMAEALFLESHPDWNYVSKPNAPQNDVWKRIPGQRRPIGGQVKFHRNGRPSTYLRDMRSDHRANRFIVPDDHVGPLKELIERRQRYALQRGDLNEYEWLAQQKARVSPLGHTSDEVVKRTHNASKAPISEANSIYISLGAGMALSLGQVGWAYSRGQMTLDDASYAFAKSTVILGTAIGTDQALRLVADGALRGGLRGQAIVGLAVLVVETSMSIMEKGGTAAFQDPAFYTQLGGSVSALAVGTSVGLGVTVLASETGPAAPVIGAVAGAVTGVAAYFAGSYATNEFLREFYPKLYTAQQTLLEDQATKRIQGAIAMSMAL